MDAWIGMAIASGSALLGAGIGAILPAFVSEKVHERQRKTEWKREALLDRLNDLYKELYVECYIMPNNPPEHYFTDWDREEFNNWLNRAIEIITPKLHLAPKEVIDRFGFWEEIASDSRFNAEESVRELYDHIEQHFMYLRKELCIDE